ncbi:hypothetical protein [Jiangella endophytica]|uniref:hypothetical protein n=1 Tax=Jiangella endophytica TaxID=1623398 RepID=UPI000E341442|nr:hypothetical protein [Jiangella endophytica]
MNKSETATILAMVQSFDRRTVGEADIAAWEAVLTDIRLDDAKAAVLGHYRKSRAWLMPADIVDFVTLLRRTRRARIPLPAAPPELVDGSGYPIPEDAEKWRAYVEWRDETLRAIADGQLVPDPPTDVLLRDMDEVQAAGDGIWAQTLAPWPGAEPVAAIEELKPRDMSALGDVVKTI